MENRFEFDLATVNIDTKDFKWKTSINVELTEMRCLNYRGLADGKDLLGKPERALKVHL
jgi:hypothetical protein